MDLKAYQLGRIRYQDALGLQRRLSVLRRENQICDILLFMEHEPVFTIGRMGKRDEILAGKEELIKNGIEVFEIERGGSTTYHGPGQLVGYPIIDLREVQCSAVSFLRKLEEVLVGTLNDFGINAHTEKGKTGVWVKNAKIASIGIHVSHWVTRHGFALNVCNSLDYFRMIVPCGMPDCVFTNLSNLLGKPIVPADIVCSLLAHFGRIFKFDYFSLGNPSELFGITA